MAKKEDTYCKTSYDWLMETDTNVRPLLTKEGLMEWDETRVKVLNYARKTRGIMKWTVTQNKPRDAKCVFLEEHFDVYLKELNGRNKGYKAITVHVKKK